MPPSVSKLKSSGAHREPGSTGSTSLIAEILGISICGLWLL
jgi:hypothetical protein